MYKLRFADGTEMEISNITQNNDNTLVIEAENHDVNSTIQMFEENSEKTSVMRYYVGTDLIRGYAGFTVMQDLQYIPKVVSNIDYSETDPTTPSGFVESYVNKIIVTMKKPDVLAAIQDDIATINGIMEG